MAVLSARLVASTVFGLRRSWVLARLGVILIVAALTVMIINMCSVRRVRFGCLALGVCL